MSVQSPSMNALHGANAMPNTLNATLRAATRRIRLLMLTRYIGLSLCISAPIGLLAVVLSKVHLLPETPSPWITGGLVGIALLAAVIVAFARPLTTLDVAKLTERRTDLKERLSSAVEFHALGVDTSEAFYGEQLADAELHAGKVNLKTAYPARVPRTLILGLLAALGLFLVYYLPTLPMFWSPKQKQDMADVKKEGIAIVKLAEDAQKNAEQQKLDETKKAAEEAKKLGEAMRKGKMDKKQSLVAMEKLTKKMEEAQKKLAASLPKKSLEQAKNEFKKSLEQQQKDVEASQKKKAEEQAKNAQQPPRDMEKKPGDKSPQQQKNQSPQMKEAQKALQQMAQALADQNQQQMQQAMEKIADQMQSGKMSKEEMQQMAQALQQLAQALKNTNMDQQSQQMQQMAQAMQSMQMDPKSLAQMAAMCKNIGKGMGQGKGMGKGELDMKSLESMMQALKNGKMTMCMGNGKLPGNGFGGKGPGRGFGGSGDPTKAMKDPGNTKPRLMAMGKNEWTNAKGKNGNAQEFAKLMAQNGGTAASKHLPNGKIAGTRLQNGNEMQQSMTGDPEAARSNAPYYQVYQTSKKAAESTLNKESIPAAYKKQVRDYFDSIKP